MTMTAVTARVRKQGPAASPHPAVQTLARQHRTLLRDVRRRATPILTLLDARTWPAAELDTLTRFLRNSVLRQVPDEEQFLFPGDHATAPFVELSKSHLRLQKVTRQLEQASVAPAPLVALVALIEELLGTLERHLNDERVVFTALFGVSPDLPGTAVLANGRSAWMRSPGEILIVLDRLPAEQAVQLSIETAAPSASRTER
jgi:hypothetical protein